MIIEYWDKVEDAVWWQVAENCDYATFYHTPAWHHLVYESIPGLQIKTIGGRLQNGTRFILPMMTTKRVGPFYGLTSAAEDFYGGIIADGPITAQDQQQIYQYVVDKWQVISLKFLPLPSQPCAIDSKDFYSVEGTDKTYVIPLSPGYEQIYKNYSRGHKSAIKKAEKAGVTVEVTEDLEDYREYYQIYLDSVDRWDDLFLGETAPWVLMENTHNLAQKMPDKIKLWVARLEGKVISGAIVLYWNKSAIYYHGANHREYFSHRAANLVQDEIIKHAAQADYAYETYDFGPSGISDGVREFKRRFGGVEQPINWWFYTHPLFLALQRMRYALSRS